MAPFILSFLRHLLRYCTFWIFVFLPAVFGNNWNQRIVTREDLKSTIDVFSQPNVMSYSQLLFDIERYQLIVGSRDYLFRLTLEGLQKLEEAHWPADEENIRTCLLKGKSEDDCRNYIKVLVNHSGKLFSCGTNGFLPECSWREINSLRSVKEWIKGTDLCPYSPHANSTALMTSQGDYYVASTIDFTGQNPVILKIMGKQPYLKTVQFDPKWLSNPSFIGAFEIDNFIYFFFREAAVEYINCGKATYSRIARVCKNDQGGQFFMKDKFTTFLKSRLNCSIPGNYPFYYNEIQSVYFLEKEEIFYATFTTSDNSIYGSAVCAYNMTSIHNSFNGAFKHQGTPKNAWERKLSPLRHFQCETPSNTDHYLDAQKYQLMNEAVQPLSSQPLFSLELQRLSHIVVDVVQTKTSDDVHVMFVATNEGLISKLVIMPNSKETCVIENIKIFDDKSRVKIMAMKLLKDTASLYIGTEESVLRLPVQRCDRFKTKGECLGAMDPYCGWNEYQLSCTSAPNRNPRTLFWHQQEITCAKSDVPIDGRWSSWSQWAECSHIGTEATGDRCMCQQRSCDNPQPSNGGRACKGNNLHVTNCTRNGQWTDWSAWSSCSATCGLALKSRVRSCGNPSPAYGGRICIGPEKDEIYCTSNPPCPASVLVPIDGHWSEWSTWEECTSSCGGGTQVRRRRCNSPPPQYGGRECHGCDQDFRICNLDMCSEKRKSTGWTPFFRVNQTKEGHFEQRFRFSCRANVPDENMLRVGQMRKEERFCREGSHSCLDATFLNVDGNWSSWSLWSQCSSSCGGGVQFRERHCNDPKPLGLGSDCVGLARMDRVCNVEACEDLDMWEEWTVWSPCDDNQEQHRRRKCRFSVSGAMYCKGSTKETRMCIPRQLSASSSSKDSAPEDGIHAEHVVGAFISGVIVGGLLAALGLYLYTKRGRATERTVDRSHVAATQLIPFKTNTYVDGNEWKNNSVDKELQQKVPLREATIKRNGNFRAQIQSDHNF